MASQMTYKMIYEMPSQKKKMRKTTTIFDELNELETPRTPGKQENTNGKVTPDKYKKSEIVSFDIYEDFEGYQPNSLYDTEYLIIEEQDFGIEYTHERKRANSFP